MKKNLVPPPPYVFVLPQFEAAATNGTIAVVEGEPAEVHLTLVGSPTLYCGVDSLDADVFIKVVEEATTLERPCGTTTRRVSQVAVLGLEEEEFIQGKLAESDRVQILDI